MLNFPLVRLKINIVKHMQMIEEVGWLPQHIEYLGTYQVHDDKVLSFAASNLIEKLR